MVCEHCTYERICKAYMLASCADVHERYSGLVEKMGCLIPYYEVVCCYMVSELVLKAHPYGDY